MRIGLLASVVVSVCMVFMAASALAGPTYTLGGFAGGERGHQGGEFWKYSPSGLAVDPASEDVYAVDGANVRVQEFGSEVTPGFLSAWGWKVNSGGSEQFEICTEASKCEQGAEGGGAGEFGGESIGEEATGVAVDPTSHDVYVTDSVNNRVEYFEADGKYLHQFNGIDIDGIPAAKPAPEGLSFPTGIAVDATGRVYVENKGHDLIDRFSASGEYECQITGKTPGAATECDASGSETTAGGLSLVSEDAGLAVDSSGNVYVADTGNNVVDEFSSTGAFVRAFGEGVLSSSRAVSVDSAGDVFALSESDTIYEFDSVGTIVAEFAALSANGSQGGSDALAVTANGSRVYVANGVPFEKELLVYGRFATPVTEPALTPVLGSATLSGTVNPHGLPVEACEFEWGKGSSGTFEHSVPCVRSPGEIGSGEAPVPVSAELNGLAEYGSYHYRLAVRNAAGPTFGVESSLLASVDVFGFQLAGANGPVMNVSESGLVEEDGLTVANPATPDSQAGSHPFAVTSRFVVNTESNGNLPPSMAPKDYYVNIPAGFAGSVAKVPRCEMSELSRFDGKSTPTGCPASTQVGVVRLFERGGGGVVEESPDLAAVYNMVPPPGVPAELAFSVAGLDAVPVTIQVRSDSDYGITAEVRNVSELIQIDGSQLTLWGVPANPAHNDERFPPEDKGYREIGTNEEPTSAGTPEVPFLTNPTKCGAVEEASFMMDSWRHPGKLAEDGRPQPGDPNWVTVHTQMYPDGITGCGKLTFQPQIEVKPTTTVADSPTGMTVDLRVPQSENPHNLATPSLKDTTVTLPQGLSISPSQANGLEGCTLAQIELHSESAPDCPNGSQVGKLKLTTPLLPEPLEGRIYLSSERSGNVYHLYLVVEGQGVLIKIAGNVVANEQTGQIVSTFNENPQLPFSELELTFYGGPTASLATPEGCGSYTTTSTLEPWSHLEANGQETGTPNATPFSSFSITSGCVSGFKPSFTAGTSNNQAGAYSPFTLSFSRNDSEQGFLGLDATLPPGLLAKLAGVAECGEGEANAGSCPSGSQIGTVNVGAGPGSDPFYVSGKVFLTGPYNGGPFGEVVIVPAIAGPFNLGTVVVHGSIRVNPITAQGSVVSDPFPTILDGIPLRVRSVTATLNRPEFSFNPTNCEPSSVTGTLLSTQGASANVASRFQAANCANLPFKPSLSVSTSSKSSRANGTSVTFKITYPKGGMGTQAWLSKAKFDIPKQLPARLSTIQKACPAATFNANPAACGVGSRIGTAVVRTQLLPVPLEGPVYFVSNGNQKFPEAVLVLQGDNVSVDLHSETFINEKTGVTSATLPAIPGVPFEEATVTLPAGPYSEFAAPGNLCANTKTVLVKKKLTVKSKGRKRTVTRNVKQTVATPLQMPNMFAGQNGAEIKQDTPITVTECPTVKTKTKTKKATKTKKHKK